MAFVRQSTSAGCGSFGGEEASPLRGGYQGGRKEKANMVGAVGLDVSLDSSQTESLVYAMGTGPIADTTCQA